MKAQETRKGFDWEELGADVIKLACFVGLCWFGIWGITELVALQ